MTKTKLFKQHKNLIILFFLIFSFYIIFFFFNLYVLYTKNQSKIISPVNLFLEKSLNRNKSSFFPFPEQITSILLLYSMKFTDQMLLLLVVNPLPKELTDKSQNKL